MQTVEKGQRIWNASLFKMNKKLQQRTGTNKTVNIIHILGHLSLQTPPLFEHLRRTYVSAASCITIVSLCPSSRLFSRGVTHPRALSILQKKRKKEGKKKKLVTCIDASIAFDEDAFLEVLCNERGRSEHLRSHTVSLPVLNSRTRRLTNDSTITLS